MPISPEGAALADEFGRVGCTCDYCGASGVETHVDHIIPRRRGGADTSDNLASACVACNLRKSDQLGWVTLDGDRAL